jgi:hypothetical protein
MVCEGRFSQNYLLFTIIFKIQLKSEGLTTKLYQDTAKQAPRPTRLQLCNNFRDLAEERRLEIRWRMGYTEKQSAHLFNQPSAV